MKSPLTPLPYKLVLLVAAGALCAATAAAQCAAPSSSGVRLCQPSAGSTVYQVPHIEATATPTSVSLFEGGVSNGTHHLVIAAKDNFGRTYQSSSTFSVTGNLPNCPTSTVGVRICSPLAGEAISQNMAMSVGFKGNAPIHRVRAYVGSTLVADFLVDKGQKQIIGSGAGTTAGSHTLTVIAWDTTGKSYKSSVQFKAFFDGGCPPKGDVCTPGVFPNTPQDGDDVQSPLRISASVENNTSAITTMRAYLNGAVVATSFGPTIDQNVSASKGTHILVIQAWDTAGKLYRSTANVNVQ